MAPQVRAAHFQADFDQHGAIRVSRIPLNPPVIIWANGLPWFPVYESHYVLCGGWNTATYLVARRYQSAQTEFSIGHALATQEAVVASNEDSPVQLTSRYWKNSLFTTQPTQQV